MSAVFQDWGPWVPQPAPTWPPVWPLTSPSTPPQTPFVPADEPNVATGIDNKTLRELIDAFRDALDAARRFDEAVGLADCEDQEKMGVLERVEELERRLDEIDDEEPYDR